MNIKRDCKSFWDSAISVALPLITVRLSPLENWRIMTWSSKRSVVNARSRNLVCKINGCPTNNATTLRRRCRRWRKNRPARLKDSLKTWLHFCARLRFFSGPGEVASERCARHRKIRCNNFMQEFANSRNTELLVLLSLSKFFSFARKLTYLG